MIDRNILRIQKLSVQSCNDELEATTTKKVTHVCYSVTPRHEKKSSETYIVNNDSYPCTFSNYICLNTDKHRKTNFRGKNKCYAIL